MTHGLTNVGSETSRDWEDHEKTLGVDALRGCPIMGLKLYSTGRPIKGKACRQWILKVVGQARVLRESWEGGAKGLKTDDDMALMSPPPPGPWGAPLDSAGPPGIKVFPKVDSQLLESAEEMNMGPRDEVFLASLDFHIAKISSFICIISASVALKSSKESRRRDSLCILYAISHSTLRVRGLSLAYSHTMGQPGHRAQSTRL